jgi:capsular polysaccharide biosynthesis protein
MVSDWSVRDEIIRVTHYWPIPVIAFLIGSLAGWGLSFILPPAFQAEVELFVAYDDARECRNPDDCKNWQLEQTDALAKSQIILEPTLSKLRAIDPFWKDVNADELSGMLDVLWRNTGKWRLVAKSNDPERSKAAVEVWSIVFLEEYQAAQEHSLRIIDLNAQVRALNQTQVQLARKLIILNLVINEISEFHGSLAPIDADEQLPELTQWKLYNLAAQASSTNPAWSIPGELAPLSDYLSWLDRLAISVDQEIELTNNQLEQLALEAKSTLDQIAIESESSHGLSRTIEVSRMLDVEPQVIESRRTTTAAVLGGIIGLLVWGMVWIAFPIWRSMK